MLNEISRRRHRRLMRLAIKTRPDTSYDDLLRFKDQGYSKVRFVQNMSSDIDEKCSQWNGKEWEIDDLLQMAENGVRTSGDPEKCAIFWLTHPNCLCHFAPVGPSGKQEEPVEQMQPPAQQIVTPEVPPMTMQPAPKPTKTV